MCEKITYPQIIHLTDRLDYLSSHILNEAVCLNVEKALEELRPFLNSDGGDISLVEIVDDKHVKVRLEGACTSCSVNQMTLRAGVETTIKKFAPQIETVENIL